VCVCVCVRDVQERVFSVSGVRAHERTPSIENAFYIEHIR
jgi:hypothetical protein